MFCCCHLLLNKFVILTTFPGEGVAGNPIIGLVKDIVAGPIFIGEFVANNVLAFDF